MNRQQIKELVINALAQNFINPAIFVFLYFGGAYTVINEYELQANRAKIQAAVKAINQASRIVYSDGIKIQVIK